LIPIARLEDQRVQLLAANQAFSRQIAKPGSVMCSIVQWLRQVPDVGLERLWYTGAHREVIHVREDSLFIGQACAHLRHACARSCMFGCEESQRWIDDRASKHGAGEPAKYSGRRHTRQQLGEPEL
jgi:hypothetical protein